MTRDGTFDISGAKWGLPADWDFRAWVVDGQIDQTEVYGLPSEMPDWMAQGFKNLWAFNASYHHPGEAKIAAQERADADDRLTHATMEGD